ncbi:hypothetical protein ACNITQ_26810, partial [Escherichia coli]
RDQQHDINATARADNDHLQEQIDDLYNTNAQSASQEARYATIASDKNQNPESNLEDISFNGLFDSREDRQAMQNDLKVLLFS